MMHMRLFRTRGLKATRGPTMQLATASYCALFFFLLQSPAHETNSREKLLHDDTVVAAST